MADNIDTRVNKIEDELEIVKASIKKTLLDIRDHLNNAENPFFSIAPDFEAKIEKEIKNSMKNIEPFDTKEIEELKAKISSFEGGSGSIDSAELNGLKEKIKTLESKISSISTTGGSIDEAALEKLVSEKIKDTEARLSELAKTDAEALSSVLNSIQDLQTVVKNIEQEVHSRSMGARIKFANKKGSSSRTDDNGDLEMPIVREKIDIFTLNELSKWTEHMLKKLGKNKFKKVVEIYSLTNLIPPYIEEAIEKLVPLFDKIPAKTDASTHLEEYMGDFALLERIIEMDTVEKKMDVMSRLK